MVHPATELLFVLQCDEWTNNFRVTLQNFHNEVEIYVGKLKRQKELERRRSRIFTPMFEYIVSRADAQVLLQNYITVCDTGDHIPMTRSFISMYLHSQFYADNQGEE